MKIKPGFMLREVAGKKIVVPVGKASIEFNGMIHLNETGAFLWERLQTGATKESLLADILAEYDVDEETAKAGIDSFLKIAQDADLLED